ncbi:MAG: hypothetical protein IJT28_00165 [Bacteroidaceae bacterium]|nr:hypothetical protein [Bacteroidaceae bacterium]
MKKVMMSFAVVAATLFMASCGNQSTNNASAEGEAEAAEVAYEIFKIEKYNASVDLVQGMRRTDDPQMDNGGLFTVVPEDADDFPVYGCVDASVYESYEEYTDERIQNEFNNIPEESVDKVIDLEKKEFSYTVPGETISEYHRNIYKGNLEASVTVAYSETYAKQLGGEVCDHILKSLKFDE